jgi:hypothetical protein
MVKILHKKKCWVDMLVKYRPFFNNKLGGGVGGWLFMDPTNLWEGQIDPHIGIMVKTSVGWFSLIGRKLTPVFSPVFSENQSMRTDNESHHKNLRGGSHWVSNLKTRPVLRIKSK